MDGVKLAFHLSKSRLLETPSLYLTNRREFVSHSPKDKQIGVLCKLLNHSFCLRLCGFMCIITRNTSQCRDMFIRGSSDPAALYYFPFLLCAANAPARRRRLHSDIMIQETRREHKCFLIHPNDHYPLCVILFSERLAKLVLRRYFYPAELCLNVGCRCSSRL